MVARVRFQMEIGGKRRRRALLEYDFVGDVPAGEPLKRNRHDQNHACSRNSQYYGLTNGAVNPRFFLIQTSLPKDRSLVGFLRGSPCDRSQSDLHLPKKIGAALQLRHALQRNAVRCYKLNGGGCHDAERVANSIVRGLVDVDLQTDERF